MTLEACQASYSSKGIAYHQMLLEIVVTIFWKLMFEIYKVFDHYLISNIFAFIKGFEIAIIVLISAIFLLIAVRVTIRQTRRLPKFYFLEITDLDGRQVSVDGLRQSFATYAASASYARAYRKMYDHQYRFRIIGSDERINYEMSKFS